MCASEEGGQCRDKTARLFNRDMVIESDYLFGKEKMVHIRHEQEMYRLQITANGKLILTK